MLPREGINLKYFNCSKEGHLAKDCKKPKNQCPKCNFLGSSYSRNCSDNSTACTAEITDSQKEEDPFAAMREMSFDAMKAYFYDMKETESLKDKVN